MKRKCLEIFRTLYSECPVLDVWEYENGIVIYTEYSSKGEYFEDYFAVTEDSIGSACSSLEAARLKLENLNKWSL